MTVGASSELAAGPLGCARNCAISDSADDRFEELPVPRTTSDGVSEGWCEPVEPGRAGESLAGPSLDEGTGAAFLAADDRPFGSGVDGISTHIDSGRTAPRNGSGAAPTHTTAGVRPAGCRSENGSGRLNYSFNSPLVSILTSRGTWVKRGCPQCTGGAAMQPDAESVPSAQPGAGEFLRSGPLMALAVAMPTGGRPPRLEPISTHFCFPAHNLFRSVW